MDDLEIVIPSKDDIVINFRDQAQYNYDFNRYSLVPLQKAAGKVVSERIRQAMLTHVSETDLIDEMVKKGDTQYVAQLSTYAKEKLDSGEWVFGIRKKTGETYAVLKETATGKIQSFITLDKKVTEEIGNLPELSAIQIQLAEIGDQIEKLTKLVERVEQGQYNDRYAGFFSARQMIIEGLVSADAGLKKELLLGAVKTNNDTIAKLMLAIQNDSLTFIDMTTKFKEAKRIDNFLQQSIGYLNSSVQLNVIAYTALGEQEAVFATLTNYSSFINQVLLRVVDSRNKSVAWKLDNAHKGENGKFEEIATEITNKVNLLVEGIETNKIEGGDA